MSNGQSTSLRHFELGLSIFYAVQPIFGRLGRGIHTFDPVPTQLDVGELLVLAKLAKDVNVCDNCTFVLIHYNPYNPSYTLIPLSISV